MHDFAGLLVGELVPRLDFVEELPAFQQFDRDVDGVVGLENCEQFHYVLVVELAHQVHLVKERFFALLLRECGVFREGLDGYHFFVLQPLREVDRREVAFADFLDGLEQRVESPLVDQFLKLLSPSQQLVDAVHIKAAALAAVLVEFDANGRSWHFRILSVKIGYFPFVAKDLEPSLESERRQSLDLTLCVVLSYTSSTS
jgi:hypothetical protein